MFNFPKQSPIETPRSNFLKSYHNPYECKTNKNSYSTLNIFDSNYLKATVPCQQQQQQHKNEIFYPNSQTYSTNSLINVKYVIDLNDLKTHLTGTNNQNTKSYDSLTTNKTNKTELSLSSGVINEEPKLETFEPQYMSQTTTKNKVSIHANFGCCQSCVGLLNFFLGFLSCFSNCCFRPCCSTAAMLGGLGALGGILAGVLFMGIVGIIPVPYEITKNICNFERDAHICQFNQTINNTPTTYNYTHIPYDLNEICFNTTKLELSTASKTTLNISNITDLPSLNGIQNLRTFQKIKDKLKMSKRRSILIRPVQYDVIFYPKYVDKNKKIDLLDENVRVNLEMKISMNIRFVCSNVTNILQLSTREFSSIEIRY